MTYSKEEQELLEKAKQAILDDDPVLAAKILLEVQKTKPLKVEMPMSYPPVETAIGNLFRDMGYITDRYDERFHYGRVYDQSVEYEMRALLQEMKHRQLVPHYAEDVVAVKMDREHRACYFTLCGHGMSLPGLLGALMLDMHTFMLLKEKMLSEIPT